MGSAGSGVFGNYRVDNGKNSERTSNGIEDASEIGHSGGTGEIECPRTLQKVQLEDIATSEYYVHHKSLPVVGEGVRIRNKIHNGRIVVEKVDTQEVLGNLPTQYNYLLNCIKIGMQYSGSIVSSGNSPIPFIVVTLSA